MISCGSACLHPHGRDSRSVGTVASCSPVLLFTSMGNVVVNVLRECRVRQSWSSGLWRGQEVGSLTSSLLTHLANKPFLC